jgi:hypothetical protein
MKNILISICTETRIKFCVQYAFTISHVLFSIVMQRVFLEYTCYDMTNTVDYYAVLHFLSSVENFFSSVMWHSDAYSS